MKGEESMDLEITWLPDLIHLHSFEGNWDKYFEFIYKVFTKDFVEDPPFYEGRKLRLKKHPMYEEKEATFWHIISDGISEESRIPNLRRCERIPWPRPIIENSTDPVVKIWQNKRNGKVRICLLLDSYNYIVILDRRDDYDLFWTAYPIDQPHQKRKLIKEYEAYINANAA